jgi:hypothetical protein
MERLRRSRRRRRRRLLLLLLLLNLAAWLLLLLVVGGRRRRRHAGGAALEVNRERRRHLLRLRLRGGGGRRQRRGAAVNVRHELIKDSTHCEEELCVENANFEIRTSVSEKEFLMDSVISSRVLSLLTRQSQLHDHQAWLAEQQAIVLMQLRVLHREISEICFNATVPSSTNAFSANSATTAAATAAIPLGAAFPGTRYR